MNKIKELSKEIEGRGEESRGWRFKQLKSSPNAYLYEKRHKDCTDVVYYEVFRRRVFKPESREIYPKGDSFAEGEKCTSNLKAALEYFEKIS